jgi:hypothetical protein
MRLLTALFFSFSIFHANSQDCKVEIPALQGKYEGDCKKNLADGSGKATGEDAYEGGFKAGLPHGKGIYKWKNGSWFDGYFKNGVKEGEGVMHYVSPTNSDSVIKGFWKNDLYAGEYEKPYKVHMKTYMVASVSVKLDKGRQAKEVAIALESVSGGSLDLHGNIPKKQITFIDIKRGNYLMRSDVDNMQKKNIYYLRDVTFPFRAIFRVDQDDDVEVEFFEPGAWVVEIKMRQ